MIRLLANFCRHDPFATKTLVCNSKERGLALCRTFVLSEKYSAYRIFSARKLFSVNFIHGFPQSTVSRLSRFGKDKSERQVGALHTTSLKSFKSTNNLFYKLPIGSPPTPIGFFDHLTPDFDSSSKTEWFYKIGPHKKASIFRRYPDAPLFRRWWWERRAQDFPELLRRLRDFRVEWGDCFVPTKYRHDPDLGAWVAECRKLGRRGELPVYQEHALEEVGMQWKVGTQESIWQFNFHELRVFKERYGHCDVPPGHQEPSGDINRDLSGWLARSLDLYLKGKMLPRHERRLRKLGVNLGEMPEKIRNLERKIFDEQIGTLVIFDPVKQTWGVKGHTGRTSVRSNLRILAAVKKLTPLKLSN